MHQIVSWYAVPRVKQVGASHIFSVANVALDVRRYFGIITPFFFLDKKLKTFLIFWKVIKNFIFFFDKIIKILIQR